MPGGWASLHHVPGWAAAAGAAAAAGREGRRRIEIVTQGPGTCSDGCPGVFGRGVGDIYLRYEVLAMLVLWYFQNSPCWRPLPLPGLLAPEWVLGMHFQTIQSRHRGAGCTPKLASRRWSRECQPTWHPRFSEAGCLPGVVAHARAARSAVSHELGSARGPVAVLG